MRSEILLHRLLYISTAKKPLTEAEMADLLRISRRNNSANAVTGLLLVGGRRFLQALEGPEAAVLQTYERIHRDPRHYAIVRLASDTVEGRTFGDWAMDCQLGRTRNGSSPVNDSIAALISRIDDPNIRGHFLGFAQARAAA